MSYKNILSVLVVIVILGSIIYFRQKSTDSYLEDVKHNFKLVDKNLFIDSEITKIHTLDNTKVRNAPHIVFLSLINSSNVRISTGYSLVDNRTISEVVEVGQIVVKDSNNVNIYLYDGKHLVGEFRIHTDDGYPIK